MCLLQDGNDDSTRCDLIEQMTCSFLVNLPPRLKTFSYSSPRFKATTEAPRQTAGVNINKYKSQRSILTSDKDELTGAEINALFQRAGKEVRDEEKWNIAIKNSYIVVSARLLANRRLVGFARATSDQALNGTLWDVITDPSLPNETLMKKNVVNYLLKELRRTVPGCSIALFAPIEEIPFFESLDFVAEPDGIAGMGLFEGKFGS